MKMLNELGPRPTSEKDATADNMIRHVAVWAYAEHFMLEIPPAGASEAQYRAYNEAIGRLADQFAIAQLLQFLKEFHPDVADDAAREVWCAWEDGGIMPELLWEWLKALDVDPADVISAANAAAEAEKAETATEESASKPETAVAP